MLNPSHSRRGEARQVFRRCVSDAELALQQFVDGLRIGLAAGRLHDLAHEPADERRLGLGLLRLVEIGSDDGVKAWLNGKVVHSNNVDRGEVTDQDTAPITLKQGTNELLLKITQGGGGWSACARIVGKDFKPIPGLEAQ